MLLLMFHSLLLVVITMIFIAVHNIMTWEGRTTIVYVSMM